MKTFLFLCLVLTAFFYADAAASAVSESSHIDFELKEILKPALGWAVGICVGLIAAINALVVWLLKRMIHDIDCKLASHQAMFTQQRKEESESRAKAAKENHEKSRYNWERAEKIIGEINKQIRDLQDAQNDVKISQTVLNEQVKRIISLEKDFHETMTKIQTIDTEVKTLGKVIWRKTNGRT